MTSSVERILAYQQILALPDPADLPGRGHRPAQPGRPDKWCAIYLPLALTWAHRRIAERTGYADDACLPALRTWSPPDPVLTWRETVACHLAAPRMMKQQH